MQDAEPQIATRCERYRHETPDGENKNGVYQRAGAQ